MSLAAGQILYNRYRIEAPLGQGGMGAVYRATDTTLSIPVAIKENLDCSPEAQKQFAREAQILARLAHPGLPRVTDYFFIPAQGQYLVMDYVEGEDLQTLIKQQGPLPEIQVLQWVGQVCDALAYLHNQPSPIIHRDIKPANIKIRPDGRAVLVDFGIAKVYDARLATTVGAQAVTPGYSPPEQYGGGRTDPRSDIYALGATLYHLLTGQMMPESVQRAIGCATPPPRQLNRNISPKTEWTILKAIEMNTDRRFQRVEELRAALWTADGNAIARPGVPVAGAPPAPQPSPQPARAPASDDSMLKVLGAAAGLLAVVLVIALVILLLPQIGWGIATPAPAPPAAPTYTPAPMPSPTPAPSIADFARGPLQFQDRFDSNDNGWWVDDNKDNIACRIGGGKYHCELYPRTSVGHWHWIGQANVPANFYLAFDAQVVDGPANSETSLMFHNLSQGHYLYTIRNDGTFRIALLQGQPTQWTNFYEWAKSPAIHPGQVNRMAVVGQGSHYMFFVNDQYIAQITDSQLTQGGVGVHLFSDTGDRPAVIEFDNLELRALP